MNWKDYLVPDKELLPGKPTIKGTRISVEHLLQLLARGWSEQEILENYPRLSRLSLQAVFTYINECLSDGLLYADYKLSA